MSGSKAVSHFTWAEQLIVWRLCNGIAISILMEWTSLKAQPLSSAGPAKGYPNTRFYFAK